MIVYTCKWCEWEWLSFGVLHVNCVMCGLVMGDTKTKILRVTKKWSEK